MEVLHSRCCGIDIHKKSITVCVLIREAGRKEQKHLREFATTTSEILKCADWLRNLGVTHVAMESTGVRKRAIVPVSHSLLVVCYYLLKRRCHFQDLGVNYFDQLNHEKLTHYFVKRLTRLGHRVTLEPCSASA